MSDNTELIYSVLTTCRTELCRLFPALNLAFAWLPITISTDVGFGTDGSRLFVSDQVLTQYMNSSACVRRGYLHTLLHCSFLHISPPKHVDLRLWNLACDILVEKQIWEMSEPRLQTENPIRDEILGLIPEKCSTVLDMLLFQNSGTNVFQNSGTNVFQNLSTNIFQDPDTYVFQNPGIKLSFEVLENAFRYDDHSLWGAGLTPETINKWESLGMGDGAMGHGSRGSTSNGVWEDFKLLKPDPRDYRPLLRKYMVPGEEMELDDENFDYIYYDFGMRQYGNLPLLEPLEYREVRRLDELVIAIDTSYSCDEATVRRFLQETYAILTAQENFFRRMNVVFMQCDCCLQDLAVIHSREEWLDYVWKLRIHGRGGTDFRPVFREIDRLCDEGILKKPKAVLYFTDGDGVYPTQPPDYETIFILAGKKIHPELLPPWAICREVL